MAFIPTLTTTDWNEEWKELQQIRNRPDNPNLWDKRAKNFHDTSSPSHYVDAFLALANLRPEDTVLDMGCGSGALAVPLGMAGHQVIAADFSQGMLDVLVEDCRNRGIETVRPVLMSWQDNWESRDIGPKSVDVAFASRSIVTADLKASLEKISQVARRKVCITLSTGSSPRADERILSAIGIQSYLGKDYIYAFMILNEIGYKPEVRYIDSQRLDTFDSLEDAIDELGKMVRDAAGVVVPPTEIEHALQNLGNWLQNNLEENPNIGQPDGHGQPQKRLRLKVPRVIRWAFISWDIENNPDLTAGIA